MNAQDDTQESGRCCESASGDGLRQYIADAFLCSPRWAVGIVWVYAVVFSVAAVYCGVRLFRCEDLGAKITWAAFMLLFAHIVIATKLWFWTLIHRNQLKREIKRLEAKLDRLGPTQL